MREAYSDLDTLSHTSILPFDVRNSRLQKGFFIEDTTLYYSVYKEKLLKTNFIEVKEPDFKLTINPLFDLWLGKDLIDTTEYSDTTNFYRNTRGIRLEGQIGKRLYFHTSFLENQATLPGWQRDAVNSLQAVPGMGRFKVFNETGFDFASSQGWISYYPIRNLNVFFGHGKMFLGHGYRSHFISHQSFNYPHIKYVTELLNGKLQVMWSVASLQTLSRQPLGDVTESLFKRKAGTFSSLNYLLGKRVQIGVFEGNIWRRYNDQNGSQRLDARAYVPVPLFGSLTSNDDEQQSFKLGLQGHIKLSDRIQLYSQYVFQNQGVQAGIRMHDLALKGLKVLAEYNQATSNISNDELIDFTHFNERLGHPVGGDFSELVVRVMYRKNRWNGSATWNSIEMTDSNRTTAKVIFGWLINPQTNLNINVGYLYRKEVVNSRSGMIYLGLQTGVFDTLFNF